MKKDFKLDFLCVGFAKCGTTSFHSALKKNPNVYLPENAKETFYLSWANKEKDTINEYQKIYYPDYYISDRVVGAIEPSYYARAKEVYSHFGPDLKLIFIIREPVNATYSLFKMNLRSISEFYYCSFYRKYKDYSSMFDNYIYRYESNKEKKVYDFDKKINEYLKYYKKENMFFIVFEELINNTEAVMNEVQKFIGVDPIKITRLPKTNAKNHVSKNYNSAVVNYLLRRYYFKHINKRLEMKHFIKFKRKAETYTLTECDFKMNKYQMKKLKVLFEFSVNNTSKIINRDLVDIWYKN